jgi:hypothetical protein
LIAWCATRTQQREHALRGHRLYTLGKPLGIERIRPFEHEAYGIVDDPPVANLPLQGLKLVPEAAKLGAPYREFVRRRKHFRNGRSRDELEVGAGVPDH